MRARWLGLMLVSSAACRSCQVDTAAVRCGRACSILADCDVITDAFACAAHQGGEGYRVESPALPPNYTVRCTKQPSAACVDCVLGDDKGGHNICGFVLAGDCERVCGPIRARRGDESRLQIENLVPTGP